MPENPVVATPAMCALVFDELRAALSLPPGPSPTPIPPAEGVGLFVTLNLPRAGAYVLRGCIGTLSPSPLVPSLRTYAVAAAFSDSRFVPVTAADVPRLQVKVSVLSDFRDGRGAYDWTIGVHGIVIRFAVAGRDYSATYLPDVCAEQGWTKEECVASLVQKAGFKGRVTQGVLDAIDVTTYVSTIAAMTHDKYMRMR